MYIISLKHACLRNVSLFAFFSNIFISTYEDDKHLQSHQKASNNYRHTQLQAMDYSYLQLADITHASFIAINTKQIICFVTEKKCTHGQSLKDFQHLSWKALCPAQLSASQVPSAWLCQSDHGLCWYQTLCCCLKVHMHNQIHSTKGFYKSRH